MNVIEASGLGKRYGGTWALRECTVAIPAGRVAALVGPNGVGKSTLLNLAVGLAQPVSRFWPFQWIEGGWLLALSVLLIAAAVWLVRRRPIR